MTWLKVDDKWHSHPKVVGLPLRARGLWITAATWSSDHLTDGFVPRGALTQWSASLKDVTNLLHANLWREVDGGWVFNDWHEYNPSAEQVRQRRRQTADRVARWRTARAEQSKLDGADVTGDVTRYQRVSNAAPVPGPVPSNYSPPTETFTTATPARSAPVAQPTREARTRAGAKAKRVCITHRIELGTDATCRSCEADRKARTA